MNPEQITAALADADQRLQAATDSHALIVARLKIEAGKLLKAARGDHSCNQTAAVIGMPYQTLQEMEAGGRYSVARTLQALEALQKVKWSEIPTIRRGPVPRKATATAPATNQ